MGWTFTYGASRKDVIDDLTKGWANDVSSTRCLRRALRGNTLYAVMEVSYKDPIAGPPTRWLAVSLLERSKEGWGSKDMDESMGPCEVSCPLGFLADVPDPGGYATEWRAKVRAFHARVNRKLAVGDTVSIFGVEDHAAAVAEPEGEEVQRASANLQGGGLHAQ